MYRRARCPKCNWVGVAEIRKGISIKDYKCPKCGHDRIRQLDGRTRDVRSEEADLKTKRGDVL